MEVRQDGVHHPSSDKDPAHGILDKKAPSRHRRVCVNGTPPGARAARAIQPTILNPPTSATKAPRRHLPRAPDELAHLASRACTPLPRLRLHLGFRHTHRCSITQAPHTHTQTHTHTHTHTHVRGGTDLHVTAFLDVSLEPHLLLEAFGPFDVYFLWGIQMSDVRHLRPCPPAHHAPHHPTYAVSHHVSGWSRCRSGGTKEARSTAAASSLCKSSPG